MAVLLGSGSTVCTEPLPKLVVPITTARYFTPSGRSIQAKGIVPDIVVEESANGVSSFRLREADLEHHLENGKEGKEGKESKEAPAPVKPQSKAPAAKPKPAAPAKDEDEAAEELPMRELASKKDYQLNQALNLLKGLQIMQSKP